MNEFEPRSIGRRQMLVAGAAGLTLASLSAGAKGRHDSYLPDAAGGQAPDVASPAAAVWSLVLSGRVVDAHDRPISGASVEVRTRGWHDRASGSMDRAIAISDGDGRFLLHAPCAAVDAPGLLEAIEYRLGKSHWRSHASLAAAPAHSRPSADSDADSRETATLRTTVRLVAA